MIIPHPLICNLVSRLVEGNILSLAPPREDKFGSVAQQQTELL